MSETAGLNRAPEPVSINTVFTADEILWPQRFQLNDDSGSQYPFQIAHVSLAPSGQEKGRHAYHGTLCFLADLLPYHREKFTFSETPRETRNENSPGIDPQNAAPSPHHATLVIRKADSALSIENESLRLALNPLTGTIEEIHNSSAGISLAIPSIRHECTKSHVAVRTHRPRAQECLPPKVTFEKGPVLFEVKSIAPTPGFPALLQQTTYRLYSRLPYIWIRRSVEVIHDTPLATLRQETLAFQASDFTHAAWRTNQGIKLEPLESCPPRQKIEAETSWMGLVDTKRRHALALLRVRSFQFNRLARPIHFRDRSLGLFHAEAEPVVYWASSLIEPGGDESAGTATAGSIYQETLACCLVAGKDAEPPFAKFDEFHARLTKPAAVEFLSTEE